MKFSLATQQRSLIRDRTAGNYYFRLSEEIDNAIYRRVMDNTVYTRELQSASSLLTNLFRSKFGTK